jgi:hypothetical protein
MTAVAFKAVTHHIEGSYVEAVLRVEGIHGLLHKAAGPEMRMLGRITVARDGPSANDVPLTTEGASWKRIALPTCISYLWNIPLYSIQLNTSL